MRSELLERTAMALRGARGPSVWIFATHAAGVLAGAILVHAHVGFALNQSDEIVRTASARDPALQSLAAGHRLEAALDDFAGNPARGALPSTVLGLGVVLPFPVAAYRGWVGGIVSVDGDHASRLGSAAEATYYVVVILLQLVPYALAAGAGVRLGLANVRPGSRYGYADGRRWLTLPREGVLDVLRIYCLVVPLLLLASLVEFLAR